MAADTPLLILGLGNTLCGDDGLGVVAVEELRGCYRIPQSVRVLDGGTLGLMLLPHVLDAHRLMLIDAVAWPKPPGSLIQLTGAEVLGAARALSAHQFGVADLLDAAQLLGWDPQRATLIGLVPAAVSLGVSLSRPVADAMPHLVASIAARMLALGFESGSENGIVCSK